MLESALDYGITEARFWDMTYAEIQREVDSKIRVRKLETQERATFDYIQANLIIKGVARVLGDKANFPTLEEAYSGVFDDLAEERKAKVEEQKTNLSALRFKQFANFHNNKYKEVASDK